MPMHLWVEMALETLQQAMGRCRFGGQVVAWVYIFTLNCNIIANAKKHVGHALKGLTLRY